MQKKRKTRSPTWCFYAFFYLQKLPNKLGWPERSWSLGKKMVALVSLLYEQVFQSFIQSA